MSATYVLQDAAGWNVSALLATTPPFGGLILNQVSHAGYFLAEDIRVTRVWLGTEDPHKDLAKANLKDFLLGSPQMAAVKDEVRAPLGGMAPPVDLIRPYKVAESLTSEFESSAPPLGPKSGTLRIKQQYIFTPYSDTPAHEPGGVLSAGRIYPLLHFTYTPGKEPDDQAPRYFRADLRIEASIDGTLDVEEIKKKHVGGWRPLNQAGIFLDVDNRSVPKITLGTIFQAAEKPIPYEVIGQGLLHGSKADWDNIHQWGAKPMGNLPSTPGAFHCFHMHWRWGDEAVIGGAGLSGSGPQFGGAVGPQGPLGKSGLALVDANNSDQNLRFAIVAIQLSDSSAIPIDWIAASNGSRPIFDDLFAKQTGKPPRLIKDGAMLALFLSVEVFRSEAAAKANKPWSGTLFPHGLFFPHEDENLPALLTTQDVAFGMIGAGVSDPIQKGSPLNPLEWVRPVGSKNQP